MIPWNMLLDERIGRHWNAFSSYEYFASALSLSLLTSRIELAAWCKQYWTFFTKCKITVMMSLSFGNVSGNSSIWFALSLLSCTLYTSWLFGCFVFCFYFIKFHFLSFVFAYICSWCNTFQKDLSLAALEVCTFFLYVQWYNLYKVSMIVCSCFWNKTSLRCQFVSFLHSRSWWMHSITMLCECAPLLLYSSVWIEWDKCKTTQWRVAKWK